MDTSYHSTRQCSSWSYHSIGYATDGCFTNFRTTKMSFLLYPSRRLLRSSDVASFGSQLSTSSTSSLHHCFTSSTRFQVPCSQSKSDPLLKCKESDIFRSGPTPSTGTIDQGANTFVDMIRLSASSTPSLFTMRRGSQFPMVTQGLLNVHKTRTYDVRCARLAREMPNVEWFQLARVALAHASNHFH